MIYGKKIKSTILLIFFKANPRCIALHSNTEIIDSNGVIIKRNAQDYTKKKELLSIEKFIKKVNYPGMALAFKRIPICKK